MLIFIFSRHIMTRKTLWNSFLAIKNLDMVVVIMEIYIHGRSISCFWKTVFEDFYSKPILESLFSVNLDCFGILNHPNPCPKGHFWIGSKTGSRTQQNGSKMGFLRLKMIVLIFDIFLRNILIFDNFLKQISKLTVFRKLFCFLTLFQKILQN